MNSHTVATTFAVILLFGGLLAVVEYHRIPRPEVAQQPASASLSAPLPGRRIVAAGRIEGRTSSVELRARITEQVDEILVGEGEWVSEGDVIVRLDRSQVAIEQDLAAAELDRAEADLERLETGHRKSEIQTLRAEYEARLAELQGAQKQLQRVEQLVMRHAASRQAFDEQVARVESLTGIVDAAQNRLKTIEAPPRADELKAARAAVAAAQSRLSIAAIRLSRTEIRAPIDGRVLRVEAEVGELTGPDQQLPLVVLADTRALRVVAEVDEFDALSVKLGQPVAISTDSVSGVMAKGRVSEIEPQMLRKQLFSDRPGERSDSFSRRIWAALDGDVNLPVGLPVDVTIFASEQSG